MISFFRRIRKGLVAQNKLSKYLLYAVGEIVLVVIGILIALAINNRQERRALAEKEQTYLAGLQEEFTTSQRKLKELITVNHQNFQGAKQLLGFVSHTDSLPTEREVSELLYATLALDIAFNPNNSLLHEIINSGSLKDISNPRLRIQLTNWIATIEDVTKQEDDLRMQREQLLDLFRSDAYSLRTVIDQTGITEQLGMTPLTAHQSNMAVFESVAFENSLLMFLLTTQAMETAHYEPLLVALEEILATISEEIETE
ncbi:MAG: hypothetical protein CMC35_06185 [Flavobacteriaceae bacterium]|nr:hypothetical protein [Flavobacteriaceae bacterium]|tara:strand:+ start:7935 stop:8705 length:771 start_codon:yes stop_codon:yes gene_type:complete